MFSLDFLPVTEVKHPSEAAPVLARQIAQVCRLDKSIGMMPVNDIGASTISLRGCTLERETSYIALSGGGVSVERK
jgi:hypothetical protein